MALDGSHLRSLRADLGSDSLKMAPADRAGWVGTGRGPKALCQQRQSENAHGQYWIGREGLLEGNLSEKPEREAGAINQAGRKSELRDAAAGSLPPQPAEALGPSPC